MKLLKKVLALIAATALVCAASGVSAEPLFNADLSLESEIRNSETTYLTYDESFDVSLRLKTGSEYFAGPFCTQIFYTDSLFKNTSSDFNQYAKLYLCSKSYCGVVPSSSMTSNAKAKFYPAAWNQTQKSKFSFCNVTMIPNSADSARSVDNLDEQLVTLNFTSGKTTGSGSVFISADSLRTAANTHGETYLSCLTDNGNVLSSRYDYGSDALIDMSTSELKFAVVDNGDVDNNKKVNSSDALMILQHSAGVRLQSGTALERCDLDGDGNINSIDALEALQISTGLMRINDIIIK